MRRDVEGRWQLRLVSANEVNVGKFVCYRAGGATGHFFAMEALETGVVVLKDDQFPRSVDASRRNALSRWQQLESRHLFELRKKEHSSEGLHRAYDYEGRGSTSQRIIVEARRRFRPACGVALHVSGVSGACAVTPHGLSIVAHRRWRCCGTSDRKTFGATSYAVQGLGLFNTLYNAGEVKDAPTINSTFGFRPQ